MFARRLGRPGLLGLAARTAVVAGTAGAVNNAMMRRREVDADAAAYEEQRRQAAMQAAAEQAALARPAAGPPSSDSEPGVIGKLERLAALQQSGVLTPEEFTAQKARILSEG